MRIEISAGGIGSGISVLDFQSDMQDYLSNADGVIASFKAVESATCDLNGGIGNLQDALAGIQARRTAEEERRAGAVAAERKVEDFLDLAARVDGQVSALVDQNRDGLCRVYPWLRPTASTEVETPWYEAAWNWLCDKGENVADGVERARIWLGETVGKAWTAAMAFYEEHKKAIDTVLIVVGVIAAIAAVVASGGTALAALVPLLTTLGVPGAIAATISTAVGVTAIVSTALAGVMNVVDVWCEVDDPAFQSWRKGLNIVSGVSNLLYSGGGIYNARHGYRVVNFKGKTVIMNDHAIDSRLSQLNMERMTGGYAAIGTDGKAIELHHLRQTEGGGIIELTMKRHRGKGMYKFWHSKNRQGYRSLVDHGAKWRAFTKKYWIWRSTADFRNYDLIQKFSIGLGDAYSARNIADALNLFKKQ